MAISITSLHHVCFGVVDLEATERFGHDFGLHTVLKDAGRLYMRTSGTDAFSVVAHKAATRQYRGVAFQVAGVADLEYAIEAHGATPIEPLDSPGGGFRVTLTDPEGQPVHLLANVSPVAPFPRRAPLEINIPGAETRYNRAQNFREIGPAHLLRLGHIALYVKDFQAMSTWYERVLGLCASDTMYAGSETNKIGGFYRIDRGEQHVDHHSLFLAQFGRTDLHHISFQIDDFEAQFAAHRFLRDQGWEANWGVGRHPVGSHVFDVWFDPDRYRWETFSDTDLVNDQHVTAAHDVAHLQMDVWSSDPADRYFE